MSAPAVYRIVDEPRPSGLARYAVDPMWPLLGVMLGGAWLGWLWHVVNAIAIGSATRAREAAIALGGFAGMALLVLALDALLAAGILGRGAIPYALTLIACWKMGVSYALYFLQHRSFELHEYYGGAVRSGLLALIAAVFIERALLREVKGGLLALMLS